VRRCKNKITGVIRAVKLLRKDMMSDDQDKRFKAEINMMSRMDHPNILKIYEVFEDHKRYYVISELCKGGDLFDLILKKGVFKEPETAQVILQILQILAFLHEQNLVHRDIKPENILIDQEQDNTLKLIDMSTTVVVKKKEELKDIEGTSYYMAPEVINKKYTSQCDLWSVGVLMFTMLSGKPPFDGNSDKEIMENVKLGEYNMNGTVWDTVSEEAKVLLKQLLQKDPHKRASAKAALKNSWFSIVEVKAVDEKLVKLCLKNLLEFNAS